MSHDWQAFGSCIQDTDDNDGPVVHGTSMQAVQMAGVCSKVFGGTPPGPE